MENGQNLTKGKAADKCCEKHNENIITDRSGKIQNERKKIMKRKKIMTGILVAAMCVMTVPAGTNAASSNAGDFLFSLKPQEYDYSAQVINSSDTNETCATAIVSKHNTPNGCSLNLRVVKHTTDDPSEDILYSGAVTVTENASYDLTYTKSLTKNMGYKLRGHVTKDSSVAGSASGSWALN